MASLFFSAVKSWHAGARTQIHPDREAQSSSRGAANRFRETRSASGAGAVSSRPGPPPPLPLALIHHLFPLQLPTPLLLSFSLFLLRPPSTSVIPMSSTGLSRRRGGAPTGNNEDDDHSATPSNLTAPSSPSLGSKPKLSSNGSSMDARGSGGALEGRGKIAFDPRDFQDGGESTTVPKLTLLEEVLLLGLKDNQVSHRILLSPCIGGAGGRALGVARRWVGGGRGGWKEI